MRCEPLSCSMKDLQKGMGSIAWPTETEFNKITKQYREILNKFCNCFLLFLKGSKRCGSEIACAPNMGTKGPGNREPYVPW